MQRRDLGEIVSRYRYVREVYSAGKKERGTHLLSSEELFKRLRDIYDLLGTQPIEEDEIDIRVKLPNNPNPIFRNWWHETIIKRVEERALIVKIDRLVGYIESEAILATKPWMRDFETSPGDKVIISPCVPVPDVSYGFR